MKLQEAASIRLSVDIVEARKVAIQEIYRSCFTSSSRIVSRNDTSHSSLDSHPLVLIEEQALRVCALLLFIHFSAPLPVGYNHFKVVVNSKSMQNLSIRS